MPKLGESITEGTIISWSVKQGDNIHEDDVLFEVSTAKVSAEIPSPVAGKMLEILFPEGETVAVGVVVAIILLEGSEDGSAIDSAATSAPVESAGSTAAPTSTAVPEEEKESRWYSPVVLQIAQEAKLSKEELDQIPGNGYMGRLSKKDIKDYVEGKKRNAAPQLAKAAAVPTVSEKIQIHAPETKGKPGVVAEVAYTPEPASAPSVSVSSGDEMREMDRVRRIIADHMVTSKKISPHVTTVIEVDVTKLVRWRTQAKDAFQKREGISLTYMPAITEATAKALVDFPLVNSSIEGYNVLLKKHINIGIAVSLNDGNLIVPVIQDADKLNMNGLAHSIDSLAAKARSNKLSPDNIQGGTFTITNFGTFKGLFGTPIINQPQVAILAVGFIEKKPAVVETPEGDTIAIRHKMYLSLSHDHRIIDGALGGNFLRRIADYLENWNA